MIALRAAAAAALLTSSLSGADEALVQAQQHYQVGLERYKAQKYDEALREFEAAFLLKPIPRVLINLGQTHLAMGNKAKALEQFQLFLRIARLADTERASVEKQVQILLAEAPAEGEADAEGEIPAPEPLPEDRVERARARNAAGPLAIVHTPAAEVPLGKAIPIVAEVPREADAVLVSLHYRNAGEASFSRLTLQPQGNAHVTAIPGRKVRSSAVQYYIEAHDGGGRLVAVSGTEISPHVVVVAGGANYTPKTTATRRMSRHRKWFWGMTVATGVLLGAGITTALLAEDRESALEKRAADSLALSSQPGRGAALFDSDSARIENEGQTFEAISVFAFALAGASSAAAGTFLFLDLQPRKRTAAAVPTQLVWNFRF